MPFIRGRKAAMLLKLEDVEGEFQDPSDTTDGILVESPTLAFNNQNSQTDEVTGSFDPETPIIGGTQVTISGSFYLKGPGEPGLAPEWGKIAKICSFLESLVATNITAATISASDAGEFLDSGNGLAGATVGTPIFVKGFANAANNGEFVVTASAAGVLDVTKPDGSPAGLVDEAAGANVTIRYGVAAVAATAGGAKGFTAQAPWSNTLQALRGVPVLISGNPATPAWSFIDDYTAARVARICDTFNPVLDSNSDVGIPAHVIYQPHSGVIPSASSEFNMDGIRWRLRGLRGVLDFNLPAGGAAQGRFQLSGLYESHDDAAVPTPTYDATRPPTWRNSAFRLDAVRAALSAFTLSSGGQTVFPDDPNDSEGFTAPQFTARRITGSMDPYMTLVATRDLFTRFRGGVEASLHARVMGGSAAPGNRIGITVPKAFYESYAPQNVQGLMKEQTGFFARGRDAGAMVVVW